MKNTNLFSLNINSSTWRMAEVEIKKLCDGADRTPTVAKMYKSIFPELQKFKSDGAETSKATKAIKLYLTNLRKL